jgi:hypothetical protein
MTFTTSANLIGLAWAGTAITSRRLTKVEKVRINRVLILVRNSLLKSFKAIIPLFFPGSGQKKHASLRTQPDDPAVGASFKSFSGLLPLRKRDLIKEVFQFQKRI